MATFWSIWTDFWFGVFPYLALGLFLGLPIYRAYRGQLIYPLREQWTARGDFEWTPRPSGFFGRRWMGTASMAFHWGVITLFVSHLLGLIGGYYGYANWIEAFHWLGLAAGLLFVYGLSIALIRRIKIPEMRAMSKNEDYIILIWLLSIALSALYLVIVDRFFGASMDVAPWVISLVKFSPDVALVASSSPITQLHLGLALGFFAYFPFTKMVHMWSYPFGYITRPYIAIRQYMRWAR